MKKIVLFLSALMTLAGCGEENFGSDKQVIQYQISHDEYAIVIVQDQGMNKADAKQKALKEAAQLTNDKDYRYFTVEEEEQVMASTPSNPNFPAPSNRYYDLIQSDNFTRDQLGDWQGNQMGTYPAYRIIFKCYKEKPNNKAIDACSLINCSK